MICYRYDALGRVDDESCTCQDCKVEEELHHAQCMKELIACVEEKK